MGAALVAISAPVYWLGLVSLYLFSKDLGVFPLFEGQGAYPSRATSSPTPRTCFGADPAVVRAGCVVRGDLRRFLHVL